jgi:hypothetical protein
MRRLRSVLEETCRPAYIRHHDSCTEELGQRASCLDPATLCSAPRQSSSHISFSPFSHGSRGHLPAMTPSVDASRLAVPYRRHFWQPSDSRSGNRLRDMMLGSFISLAFDWWSPSSALANGLDKRLARRGQSLLHHSPNGHLGSSTKRGRDRYARGNIPQ